MKKITFLLALFTATIGFAQTTLEDFEGTTETSGFSGMESGVEVIANPVSDSNNNSANVLRLITNTSGDGWQGANVVMQSNYIDADDPVNETVSVQVYSTVAFTMLGKLDSPQGSAVPSAADAAHTGSGWETLTFTFNENLDNTMTANGEYKILALFPNWSGSGWNDPIIDATIYVDNVVGTAGGSLVADPAPTDAPATPTANSADVTSLYSDAYTDVGSNTTPGWSEDVTEEEHASNNVYKTTNFLPFALTSPIDITPHNTMHVDVWLNALPGAGAGLLIKLLDAANGPHEAHYTVPIGSLTAGSWNSFDIPLSSFAQVAGTWDAAAQASVDQVIVDIVDDALMYVDNVYFFTDNTASTDDNSLIQSLVMSNPTDNEWTIRTSNTNIKSVQLFNILGKQVYSAKLDRNEVAIPARNLTTGIYIARVQTELGTKSIKLIRK